MQIYDSLSSKFIRFIPSLYWTQYSMKARQNGIDQLFFVISFDCDTPEDIIAAEKLSPWLKENNIKITFAVPGKQLLEGKRVFQNFAKQGAEFINHGALPHTEWRNGRYWSTTFYREMPIRKVIEDIKKGHELLSNIIETPVTGFRAPHFGLFEKPSELALIHETIEELGYRFSTSTTPIYAFQYGPLWKTGSIWEIPLSGSYQHPLSVFDSWSHIESPYSPKIKDEYGDIFIQTIDQLLAMNITGVLNYYVDPAHVANSDAFYRAMKRVMDKGIPSCHYSDLINLTGN